MDLKSAIESILFIHGEPIKIARLVKIVGAPKKDVESALAQLVEEYRDRGMRLIQNNDEWQLATNPKNKEAVAKFLSSDLPEELTRAALEILAIIAYKGPISRANIEYIRGVDSSFVLRNILIRGLVARDENPKDRRSFLYRISGDFLKYAGLTKLSDLPRYEELHAKETNEEGIAPEKSSTKNT